MLTVTLLFFWEFYRSALLLFLMTKIPFTIRIWIMSITLFAQFQAFNLHEKVCKNCAKRVALQWHSNVKQFCRTAKQRCIVTSS